MAWLPDMLLKVDGTEAIRFFRPAPQGSLVLAADEAVGKNLRAVFPAAAAEALAEAVAAVIATGEPLVVEFALSPAGRTDYYEARVARGEAGTAWVILRDISDWRRYEACDLLLLDISQRMQAEEPLAELLSHAAGRLRTTFAARLVWVACRQADGRLVFHGGEGSPDAAAVPAGADGGDGLVGSALRTGKFQLMDIKDPRMAAWRRLLAEQGVSSGAAFPLKVGGIFLGALLVFAAGVDFWTRRTIVQLTNCAEQLAIAVYITTNRQRLKLLTTGLESAANAVVITDRQGFIQWVNPAFFALSGYRAAEVVGSNARRFAATGKPPMFYRTVWRHVAAGRIWHGEIESRRREGSRYTAEMTVTPVRDDKGQIANYIAIIQDITARKESECAMAEAREALARAERQGALGIMAAGIAHEINQPLNSLKVLADGMLYWHRKGRTADIGQAMATIGEISKEADRIDAIIKHMRAFIHDSQAVEPRLCSLNHAVESSLSMLGAQLTAHNIGVKTDLAAGLPPLLGSGIQLEQVVINLLVNAMNALDSVDRPDKEIEVATGRRRDRVFLAVGDNGPGISKAIKDKIFEPFFTTKSAGGGMGLGLSVVNSIVAAGDGEIEVKDRPAGGVVFLVEFPAAPSRQRGEDG